MLSELNSKWTELKTPVTERVSVLADLLDGAKATPQMISLYENITTKLTDRQPIAQVN